MAARPSGSSELAAIEAPLVVGGAELRSAEAEAERATEALQMAQRSVGAFESELTVRAGEDVHACSGSRPPSSSVPRSRRSAARCATPRRTPAATVDVRGSGGGGGGVRLRAGRHRDRRARPPHPQARRGAARSISAPRAIPFGPSSSWPTASGSMPTCSGPRSTGSRPRSPRRRCRWRRPWPRGGWPATATRGRGRGPRRRPRSAARRAQRRPPRARRAVRGRRAHRARRAARDRADQLGRPGRWCC